MNLKENGEEYKEVVTQKRQGRNIVIKIQSQKLIRKEKKYEIFAFSGYNYFLKN